ncbi:hypothetical protein BJF79_24210 [Actinomadura sp. CNU-125]|nr:hypothetical protein [Actinomadura sp. CNU-125]OLT11435.1 hypothetical protein BJF79_24210 [Actinomadura sp. CNU-125]
MFLRCLVPGEDGGWSTRPVPAAELFDRHDPAETEALRRVVRAFAPLLAVTGDHAPDPAGQQPTGRTEQIVLTRPALPRAWPRLRNWLDDRHEELNAHHRTRQAAHTWNSNGQRRGDVLTGANLDKAAGWAASGHPPHPNRAERGLLDASTRAQTARARRVRITAVVLAITTLLSLAATGWAVRAQDTANRQRDNAASRQLAAQSRQFSSADPGTAALLAVAAQRIQETPESRAALDNILTQSARGGLNGYVGSPAALAADGEGRLLAVGNYDGTVELWDVHKRRRNGDPLELLELSPTSGQADFSVALSPDGGTLAAAVDTSVLVGEQKPVVRIWDVRSRRHLGDLPVPEGAAPGPIAFTPDGKSVAVTFSDLAADAAAATDTGAGVVELWDVRPFGHRPRLQIPRPGVVSPDATTMAVARETTEGHSTVELVDLATGARKKRISRPGEVLALGPKGRTLITTKEGEDGETIFFFWDTRAAQKKDEDMSISGVAEANVSGVDEAITFSPDGRVVAIGTQLWTADGIRLGSIDAESSNQTFVGNGIVAGIDIDSVRLWDLTVHQADPRPIDIDARATGISRNGRVLVAEMEHSPEMPPGGSFQTWNVANGKKTGAAIAGPKDRNGASVSIEVGADGMFATADPYGGIDIWDPAAGQWLPLDISLGGAVSDMAFSPDGRFLAVSGGYRGEASTLTYQWNIQLWDVKKRVQVTDGPLFPSTRGQQKEKMEEVGALAFSPDSRTLAARIGRTVRLFDLSDAQNSKEIRSLVTYTGTVQSLAFSPVDNQKLAIGGESAAFLWDVEGRHQIGIPFTSGSPNEILGPLVFSPDGHILAVNEEERILLWDATVHAQVGAPLNKGGVVQSLAFSSDGASLITTGGVVLVDGSGHEFFRDGIVQRWNMAIPADPLAAACAIANRNMTRTEWSEYVPSGVDYLDVCPAQ